jgi:hypothetical protein
MHTDTRGTAVGTTRTLITVTPLYPGSFFPEHGRPISIINAEPETALKAAETVEGVWFALEVRTTRQKLWTDGDGGEMWMPVSGNLTSYRIYAGEEIAADQLIGDEFDILRSNMRSNGWNTVVRTRRGNYQPIKANDVVVSI